MVDAFFDLIVQSLIDGKDEAVRIWQLPDPDQGPRPGRNPVPGKRSRSRPGAWSLFHASSKLKEQIQGSAADSAA